MKMELRDLTMFEEAIVRLYDSIYGYVWYSRDYDTIGFDNDVDIYYNSLNICIDLDENADDLRYNSQIIISWYQDLVEMERKIHYSTEVIKHMNVLFQELIGEMRTLINGKNVDEITTPEELDDIIVRYFKELAPQLQEFGGDK